jgi:hypothetical protein
VKHTNQISDVERKLSRAQLLRATALGVAAAALPSVAAAEGNSGSGSASSLTFPYFPQIPAGSYTPETPQEIVSNLLTLKVFDTTLAAFSLTNSGLLQRLNVVGAVLTVFQAITAKEQYQIDWLQALVPGAAPVTSTFTVDPALARNTQTFAAFAQFTGYVYLGAELTAAREFAELGQPALAKDMAQLAAAEAEDIAAFRTLLLAAGAPGVLPPNNKAFETETFLYTRDAVALMRQVGLIGGAGVSLSYPGRDAVLAAAGPMASAVIQKTPNNANSTIAFTSFTSFGGERS